MKVYNSFSELGIHIYNLFNEVPFKLEATVPKEFQPVVDFIYDCYKFPHPTYTDAQLLLPEVQSHSNNLALASFTGGKDSTYIALKLIESGYHPELYYVTGLNRGLSTEEFTYAKNVVSAIGTHFSLDLTLDQIAFDGTYTSGNKILPEDSVAPGEKLMENPFKNQYVLCKLLDIAVSKDCHYICQGNHASDFASECLMIYAFTDVIELYEHFEACVNKFYQVKLGNIPADVSYVDIIDYISNFPSVFPHIYSCVMPSYKRISFSNRTHKKFPGLRLLPGRCGVCHKCRADVISLALLGKVYDINDPLVIDYIKDSFRYLSQSVTSKNYRYLYQPDLPLKKLLYNFTKYGIL